MDELFFENTMQKKRFLSAKKPIENRINFF